MSDLQKRKALAVFGLLVGGAMLAPSSRTTAQDVTSAQVLTSIKRGQEYLIKEQNADGSWTVNVRGPADFATGTTSLATLALLDSGMTMKDEPVKKALEYLRSKVKEPEPDWTYEIALMIMALESVKDGEKDLPRIRKLAEKLEAAQRSEGEMKGIWGYTASRKHAGRWVGDRSNASFAIQGLNAAAKAGVSIKRKTWQLAQKHLLDSQLENGGWNYTSTKNINVHSTSGSMTAAGIIALRITSRHLQELNPQANQRAPVEKAVKKAVQWMDENCEVGRNPGTQERLLYYHWHMQEASRLSGHGFFGTHDWFRETARYFIRVQQRVGDVGAWKGRGPYEKEPIIGTSFAIRCLSNGLAPVLMQRLALEKSPEGQPNNKNRGTFHPHSLGRLTEHLSGLSNWPRLITWQTGNLNQIAQKGRADQLRRVPILYMSGKNAHSFTKGETRLLRNYVDQGGTILAVAATSASTQNDFEDSFSNLMEQMFPKGECRLQSLSKEHALFQCEHELKESEFDMLGGEFQGRTAIFFSRDDLGRLWSLIGHPELKGRSDDLTQSVERMRKLGVNLATLVTNGDPPLKLPEKEGQ